MIRMVDFSKKISSVRKRFEELEQQLQNPESFSPSDNFAQISREHQRLSKLITTHDRVVNIGKEIEANKVLLKEESDAELITMIKADLSSLEEELPQVEKQLKFLIVPPNPNDSKNCIVEIRPAAGGDEATLFVEDLYRMYTLYSQDKGWSVEVLDSATNEGGGLKNISFMVKGEDVYKELSFESGVHRVQRVPTTESQGRIHTSTVTVAVLLEVEEVDIQLNMSELKFDTFRASGAGGQCVNTTDSAVRVTHIPTGIFVASQQERSQHKNKEIALKILRSRLYEIKMREEQQKNATARKGQVGTGDRSEKIRTYNYPQNRVSDHRYNITLYDLSNIMLGKMYKLIQEILTIEAESKLEEELSS